MKNLKQVRQQIVAEYAEVDVKVDVYFHNSNQANLVELNWLADNNSSVIGAFVHLGDDEYFNRYGNHTYAVVIDSEQGSIRGSILEDVDGNSHTQIFINKNSFEELVEVV